MGVDTLSALRAQCYVLNAARTMLLSADFSRHGTHDASLTIQKVDSELHKQNDPSVANFVRDECLRTAAVMFASFCLAVA
ncbi:hypothetical protein [Paraburkholderia sp. BL17N1]|uniref:hypothetical protein n=1 Tax=Paraburkholderia sp. BL17N1 TaxID=1938798 RepID=UPI000EB4329D|nr:hypothetical protein [Paraburkholderia sp. BL17N1]RKR31525.1 hypothetical protein B0G82_7705 [Paraburkholderia sp. BL17N1]